MCVSRRHIEKIHIICARSVSCIKYRSKQRTKQRELHKNLKERTVTRIVRSESNSSRCFKSVTAAFFNERFLWTTLYKKNSVRSEQSSRLRSQTNRLCKNPTGSSFSLYQFPCSYKRIQRQSIFTEMTPCLNIHIFPMSVFQSIQRVAWPRVRIGKFDYLVVFSRTSRGATINLCIRSLIKKTLLKKNYLCATPERICIRKNPYTPKLYAKVTSATIHEVPR